MRKVDPNKSGSLGRFAFVRWYMEEEISLDSTEEAEHLVGWGCKANLLDIHLEFVLEVH